MAENNESLPRSDASTQSKNPDNCQNLSPNERQKCLAKIQIAEKRAEDEETGQEQACLEELGCHVITDADWQKAAADLTPTENTILKERFNDSQNGVNKSYITTDDIPRHLVHVRAVFGETQMPILTSQEKIQAKAEGQLLRRDVFIITATQSRAKTELIDHLSKDGRHIEAKIGVNTDEIKKSLENPLQTELTKTIAEELAEINQEFQERLDVASNDLEKDQIRQDIEAKFNLLINHILETDTVLQSIYENIPDPVKKQAFITTYLTRIYGQPLDNLPELKAILLQAVKKNSQIPPSVSPEVTNVAAEDQLFIDGLKKSLPDNFSKQILKLLPANIPAEEKTKIIAFIKSNQSVNSAEFIKVAKQEDWGKSLPDELLAEIFKLTKGQAAIMQSLNNPRITLALAQIRLTQGPNATVSELLQAQTAALQTVISQDSTLQAAYQIYQTASDYWEQFFSQDKNKSNQSKTSRANFTSENSDQSPPPETYVLVSDMAANHPEDVLITEVVNDPKTNITTATVSYEGTKKTIHLKPNPAYKNPLKGELIEPNKEYELTIDDKNADQNNVRQSFSDKEELSQTLADQMKIAHFDELWNDLAEKIELLPEIKEVITDQILENFIQLPFESHTDIKNFFRNLGQILKPPNQTFAKYNSVREEQIWLTNLFNEPDPEKLLHFKNTLIDPSFTLKNFGELVEAVEKK